MSKSESQFRIWYKKKFPNGFIVKFPDFKQTGMSHAAGIPDFLTICDGVVVFYEVKTWKNKGFTPAQVVVFPRMIACGAVIIVWIKEKRGFSQFIYK